MKVRYGLLAGLCLALSVPLAILLLQRRSASVVPVVRVATFNASLNRAGEGELLAELRTGKSEQAAAIAEIVQRAGVDVLLVCELDRDRAAETASLLARGWFAVSQRGQQPIDFEFCYVGDVNTGEPSGRDLDGDGRSDGPGDAHGFGAFPGQYGMALLSRHPILQDRIRTFRTLRWATMPGALRPEGYWPDEVWSSLRLSSKSHWDVPIGIGKQVVHVLCSHPTPPVFDGPEDRNGRRNHDEIRFWVDYLTPGAAEWIVDDAGRAGGLPAEAPFVLLGDLNCDPFDGDARREALQKLLQHPRVQDPAPRGAGGETAARQQWQQNATHQGDPAMDTGDFPDEVGKGPGNLRVDYVLVSRQLPVRGSGVFWPLPAQPGGMLVSASDHRLVFVDIEAH
jgi:hypothetical protein